MSPAEPSGRNLVLIGFMASGKSTIGRWCARALGYRFRDSDTLVERRAGKSVPEIFAEQGEEAFRAMESRAIRDLARSHHTVIATGGGAVLNTGNVWHLRRSGVVVLLWSSPDDILARAGSRVSRPLLATAEDPRSRIESLLAEREPYYRSAAHIVVDTSGLTREDATECVLEAFRSWQPHRQPDST